MPLVVGKTEIAKKKTKSQDSVKVRTGRLTVDPKASGIWIKTRSFAGQEKEMRSVGHRERGEGRVPKNRLEDGRRMGKKPPDFKRRGERGENERKGRNRHHLI